jgi:glycosyltransferase involved in cell wall biosynthesis
LADPARQSAHDRCRAAIDAVRSISAGANVVRQRQGLPKRACLLSASRIADDTRVRRQGDALAGAGWQVTGIGFAGLRSRPPAWTILELPHPGEPVFARRITRMLALIAGGRVPPLAPVVHARAMIAPFYAAAAGHAADLYIANDWPMLPLAVTLARRFGGRCLYDSHELAVAEYSDSRKWRLFSRPYVRAIESRCIAGAAAVLTVSDGIADRLQRQYGLAVRPTVIRNMPSFCEPAPRRFEDGKIRALYHGLLAPGRGLEQLVRSVEHWRPQFGLTIRGPGTAAYLDRLRGIATAAGTARRIEFAVPVPLERVIEEAAKADIGIVAMPGDTPNNALALPNKFFDYIMAGLALCVTNLPEMASIVQHHDLGRVAAGSDAPAIAAAVNAFSPELVERYRANARLAAREFNWEREGARLVELCERAAATTN